MYKQLARCCSFVLVVMFSIMQMAIAQAPDTGWTKTYGVNDWNYGKSVHQTFDGGFIIAGQTQSVTHGLEFWLLRTNSLGDTLWTKTYGGSNFDEALYVEQTSDSGFIMTGVTRSFGAGDNDIWLLKTDTFGDTIWSKTYGGTSKDNAYVVRQTTDGGYILTGGTRSFSAGYYDLWLLKTDSLGDTLWVKTYGTGSYESGFDVQQTTDGGYIVAGGAIWGNEDFWLLRTDSFGDTLWTKTYGGSGNEEPSSVIQTSDGGYLIVGLEQSFGAGAGDVWLVKTDAAGLMLWTKTYGGTNWEKGRTVQQTADGGFFITAMTQSFGAGGIDFWLIKTDPLGDTLWTKLMGGINDDEALSGQQTSDGGYIVTGYTQSFGANVRDLWMIKLDGPNSPIITSFPLDIQPGHCPNYIKIDGGDDEDIDVWAQSNNLTAAKNQPHHKKKKHKKLKAAILGTADFDASLIDPSTVLLAGVAPLKSELEDKATPVADPANCACTEDEEDGIVDLEMKFSLKDIMATLGEVSDGDIVELTVTGNLYDGTPFEGTDCIWIRADDDDDDDDKNGSTVPLSSTPVLKSNYPNPFNPATEISFSLPNAGPATLEVFNVNGRKVATLVDGTLEAGDHTVTWDGGESASGMYFYRLTSGDFVETRKMILLK